MKKKSDILMILNGLGSSLYLNLIGRLTLSELLVFITIPFTSSYKKINLYYGLRTVLTCLLLMVFFQIISDFANQSLFTDWTRGISVLLVSILSIFFFIDQLNKNVNSIIYFFAGFAIIHFFTGSSITDSELWTNTNYFKARAVEVLNPIILILSFYLYKNKKRRISVLIILFYSFVCFVMDARSNGLIFLASAYMLSLKIFKTNINKSLLISHFSAFFVIFFGLYIVYVNQVLYNNFGGSNSRSQLNKASNPYNPIEIIYYGRIGLVVAGYAIHEKPFLGHGSWAKDKGGKYAQISADLRGAKALDKSIIPSHSVIIGAWLYMGIFGFIVALYLMLFFMKLFFKLYLNNNSAYLPIIVILSIEMMWHFLFSPFGTIRTSFPIIISLIIVMHSQFNKKHHNH